MQHSPPFQDVEALDRCWRVVSGLDPARAAPDLPHSVQGVLHLLAGLQGLRGVDCGALRSGIRLDSRRGRWIWSLEDHSRGATRDLDANLLEAFRICFLNAGREAGLAIDLSVSAMRTNHAATALRDANSAESGVHSEYTQSASAGGNIGPSPEPGRRICSIAGSLPAGIPTAADRVPVEAAAEDVKPGPTREDKLSRLRIQFRQSIPADLTRLREAASLEEWTTVAHIAHQLKGCAASFGYPDTGALAAELDASIRAGSQVRIVEAFSALAANLEALSRPEPD